MHLAGGARIIPPGPPGFHSVDYTKLLLDNLELIDRVVHFIARRHRMSAADVEEFSSVVRLKLLDRDFAILRKFEGRSNMATYLTTVVERLYLDDCISRWGKWRPSATARRLGPVAVHLEQLTARDGLSFSEAVGLLQTNHGVTESRDELAAMAQQFPARVERRLAGEEELALVASRTGVADADLQLPEDRELADQVTGALARSLDALSADDRLLLKLRFVDGHPVPRIATLLGLEPKPVYRRLEHLEALLKRGLQEGGIQAADAERLIGHTALTLGQLIENMTTSSTNVAPENPHVRPSNR